MKVVIIGAGNVGTILGKKIAAAGHELQMVFSRRNEHAAALGSLLNCAYTSAWKDIPATADINVVATSDAALGEIAAYFKPGNRLVVHTAGSVSMDILKPSSRNYGVLYPLQTLRKELEIETIIPFLIDGNTADDRTLIVDFAKTISPSVTIADDECRMKLHLAATILNNFNNHLATLTRDYCDKESLHFSLLFPLLEETITRLSRYSPSSVQTGPAIRNDYITLERHVETLKSYPGLQQIYKLFSESIVEYYR